MIAKLIVASGKSAGRAISLKNGQLLIGRAEECDIRPLGEEVSRRHCSIVLEADTLTVEDLGSRNGTYVNGAKIEAKTRVRVKHGDVVRVGPLEVTVSADKPAAPAAVDDVSRWLMADDEPAGMFDTTQTIRAGESPSSVVPVPAEPAAEAAEPAVTNAEPAPVAAAAAAPDDSASRAAAVSAIDALRASRTQPGTLPPEAKKSKSDSSRDAAADALRKFFGKR